MSNLTDFFGKSTSRVAGTAPHSQPAFTILGGGSSTQKYMAYSHDLNLMSHGVLQTTTDPYQTEGTGNIGFWSHTTQPTSHNNSNNAHGIANNGYLGCASLMTSGASMFLGSGSSKPLFGYHRHASYGLSTAMVGTNPGIKQNYALATSHDASGVSAWIRVCGRSNSAVTRAQSGFGGNIAEERAICRPQAAGWLTSGYRLASGGISYNQNTGNAIIIERDSSGHWRPVLLKNSPNPAEYISDQAAWQAAITAAVAVSGNRIVGPIGHTFGNRSTAGMTAAKAVLCDDNSVVMMVGRTSGVEIVRWDWDNSANNWAAQAAANAKDLGSSTVYHTITGNYPNFTMSLDGKTIILTSQGYQYSCGFYLTMIDVATGHTKSYYQIASNICYTIVPLGASKFLFSDSQNSDGNSRLYATVLSWDDLHTDPATDYWSTGFVNNKPATPTSGFLDTPHHTTNYSAVVPIIGIDNEAIVLAEKGEI
jgi:hypothetical protein